MPHETHVHWSSEGSGPAIIFVHGWICDETSWSHQTPALSKRFRVITLDLPGHGKSGPPKDGKFTMALFARAVEAVRADAKVDKAVFAGHSMGTSVIRRYALTWPQHVAGLVLVDGQIEFAAEATVAVPFMTGAIGRISREKIVRRMFGHATTASLRKQIMRMMMRTSDETAVGALLAACAPSTITDTVIDDVPVLAVYPDHEPSASEQDITRIFPTARLRYLAGTGHFLMMEMPNQFNQLIAEFVGDLTHAGGLET